jgi:hypothetical protein
MKQLNVTVPTVMLSALKSYVSRSGLTQSECVRRGLEMFFDSKGVKYDGRDDQNK